MFLHDEVENPIARILLAHGAGAPMDHPWLNNFTSLMTAQDISVSRFEFEFMIGRRTEGKRRPAPRADKLIPEYEAAVAALLAEVGNGLPLFVGGKSLGGRVASLAAPNLYSDGKIAGIVSLCFPFHPSVRADGPRVAHVAPRAAHLAAYDCPALIVQGTRDPLGNLEEVRAYQLASNIKLCWLEDGDHDLKPRMKSGFTLEGHMQSAADAVMEFIQSN